MARPLLRRRLGDTLFLLAAAATPCVAQIAGDPRAVRVEQQLVVSITGELRRPDASEGLSIFGAGIVVAIRDDALSIVTARHVVALESAADDSICVKFGFGADTSCYRARRVFADRSLDLAVLSIAVPAGRRAPVTSAMLSGRRGSPQHLEFRHPLEVVGCPAGQCWQPNAEPQLFEMLVGSDVFFHTTSVQTGNSGGGLFNRWGEVVGMVVTDGQSRARAIGIDVVMDRLKALDVPAQLDPPSYPRGGYSSTIGAVVLAAGPRGKLLSTRATLERQIATSFSWHVGALRLAPANISLTAAMGGASVDIRRGRLAFSPFIEAGIGQTDAQYDSGGHFVESGSTTRYVPFWQPVQGSALGGGVGASLQMIVLPRLIVEGIVGSWRFSTPDLSPSLPRIASGIGVRWSLAPR